MARVDDVVVDDRQEAVKPKRLGFVLHKAGLGDIAGVAEGLCISGCAHCNAPPARSYCVAWCGAQQRSVCGTLQHNGRWRALQCSNHADSCKYGYQRACDALGGRDGCNNDTGFPVVAWDQVGSHTSTILAQTGVYGNVTIFQAEASTV